VKNQVVQFDNDDFNPLFWKLRKSKERFVISYGGAGSGKSFSMAQYFIILALTRKTKILVLRKVGATLKDSVVPLIWDTIITGWGIRELFSYNKTDRIITCISTGAQIIFRGLDDPEKIKSITDIRNVWGEEASEYDQKDIEQINLRLRGLDDIQIFLTFNPIDVNHWLKERFFDDQDQDTAIFKTTYLDNKFIDDEYIKQLERYKVKNFHFYNIYALGNWGKLDVGGEFYKSWSNEKHIKDVEYNSDLPLHITFDENVNPYLTLCVWQAEEKNLRQIDEICLKHPYNTLKETIKEFKRRYKMNKNGLYIYGDRTSLKSDTKLEKGQNFYTIARNELTKYSPVLRLPSANPPVVLRGNFINEIFSDNFDNIEISIHSRCKNSIQDYNYLKEASDGTKAKQMTKDPQTGVRFQEYGHTSDASDYFICEYLKNSLVLYQKGDTEMKFILRPRNTQKGY